MSAITELEFWKIQDVASTTELQRASDWKSRVAGKAIRWRGAVREIKEKDGMIFTAVDIQIGDDKSLCIFFDVSLMQRDYYLKFSPRMVVEVTGTFSESPPSSWRGYYSITGGRIHFVS